MEMQTRVNSPSSCSRSSLSSPSLRPTTSWLTSRQSHSESSLR